MPTTAALPENSRQGINSKIPPCLGLGARLTPNPVPGCRHAYDETPVGLVVYVRNDPVNLIDPDGRSFFSAIGSFFGKIGHAFASAVDFYVDSFRDEPPPPMDTEGYGYGYPSPYDDYDQGGAGRYVPRAGYIWVVNQIAIHQQADIDPECGITSGGCVKADYRPEYTCQKDAWGNAWVVDFTITLVGDIYVATGPFPYKGRNPQDRSITNTATALAHERRHVSDAEAALRNFLEATTMLSYGSQQECISAAVKAELGAGAVWSRALQDSQRRRGEEDPDVYIGSIAHRAILPSRNGGRFN